MLRHTIHSLCITASLALLTACGGGQPTPADQPATAASSEGLFVGMIDNALDKASAQVAANNLTLSSNHGNAPKAAITPQGDLLIDGKAVPITATQRSELLAYRKQVVQLAQNGRGAGAAGAGARRAWDPGADRGTRGAYTRGRNRARVPRLPDDPDRRP